MPRTSKKAPKIGVDELNPQQEAVFAGMVSELAIAMEKIAALRSFQNDIKARCEEELGVAKKDLAKIAKIKFDEAKVRSELRSLEVQLSAAERIGIVKYSDRGQ